MKAGPFIYRFLLLLLGYYPLSGAGQARMSVLPDRKLMLIGEPIRLQVDIVAPEGLSLLLDVPVQNPHWVFLQGDTGSLKIEGGKETIRKTWVLTSYDTGYWSLPRWQLRSPKFKLRSDTIGIRVAYTAEDLSQDYRDIKEVLVTPVPSEPSLIRWLIPVILTLAVVLLFLYWRKKKGVTLSVAATNVSNPQDLESEWDKAYEAYRKNEMDGVRYYERADQLVRAGIHHKYQFDTLHATTADIRDHMKQTAISGKEQKLLVAFLEEAELVKFARFEPLPEGLKKHYDGLKAFFHFHSKP